MICFLTRFILDFTSISASCIESTTRMTRNSKLNSFFKRKAADPSVSSSKSCVIEAPCAGLCDATWKRPRAKQSIAQFMEKTCSIYCGSLRHVVCKDLFGQDSREINLNTDQKARLITALDARSIWAVKRHAD